MTLSTEISGKLFGGVFVLLFGLGILYVNARDAAPALQALSVHEARVSGPLRVVRVKNGSYMRVPLGTLMAQAREGCGTGGCTASPRLAVLRPGVPVKAWLAGDEIWQLESQGQVVIDYADVRAAHRQRRFWLALLGACMMLGGAATAWWGLRPEPPDVGPFDR